METTFHPHHTKRSVPGAVGASFLCLVVLLVAGCSVDLDKLRPQRVSDGSVDQPAGTDAIEDASGSLDASGNLDSRGGGVDSASVLPDLPSAGEVALPSDAADVPTDLAEPDLVMDVVAPREVSDPLDVSTADKNTCGACTDGGEETGGVGGTGGSGSGGTGGAGGVGGTGGFGSGGSGGMGGADPDLVLWYKFDESSGTTAADSSTPGGAPHDGALMTYGTGGGSASFSTDVEVGTHALRLTPSSSSPSSSGGYVVLPALHPLAPDALSITVWVKLAAATSAQDWERILDCATDDESTGPFFYITARSNATNTPVRFGISQTGHDGNVVERLDGKSTLTANVWHHIAVVLPSGSPYTGILYIDGVVAGTNNAMTLHLSDLAITTNNWLGRSEFSADPFFNGSLDDFRVYKRTLSQEEISALFALR